jgi:hypothetical protein
VQEAEVVETTLLFVIKLQWVGAFDDFGPSLFLCLGRCEAVSWFEIA